MQVFWHFVTQDWYFAFPMFGMSLIAITLVIWRILLNININTNLDAFLQTFQQKLASEGVDGAIKYCKSLPGAVPRKLFVAGLEASKQGLAAARRGMANVVEFEIQRDLNFLLPTILAIAKIATMVGLLGTVISMIGTFSEIAELKRANKEVADAGSSIGLALFATALGLVTAIPLVFAHVQFKAWIADFEIKMKSAAQKLLVLLQAHKSAPTRTPASTGS